MLFQRNAIDIVHHQERGAAVGLLDGVDADDVLVRHLGRRPRLAAEALAGGGVVGQLGVHELDGDEALQAGVAGLEHDAHAAAADHLDHVEAVQPADAVVRPPAGRESPARSPRDGDSSARVASPRSISCSSWRTAGQKAESGESRS